MQKTTDGPDIPASRQTTSIQCPYCSSHSDIDPPESGWQCIPVPLARWAFPRKDGWSRIGEDFLPLLSWDRLGPGILQVKRSEKVYYRRTKCQNTDCDQDFEIFSCKDTTQLKEESWPHIFRDAERKKPLGIRTMIAVYQRVFRIEGTELGYAAVALLLYLLFAAASKVFQGDGDYRTLVWATMPALAFAAYVYAFLKITDILRDGERLEELLAFLTPENQHYWRRFHLSRYQGYANNSNSAWSPSQRTCAGIAGMITFACFVLVFVPTIEYPALLEYRTLPWMALCYFCWLSIWVSFQAPLQVVSTLTRLPIKPSPLNAFAALKPVDMMLSVSFLPAALYAITVVILSFGLRSSQAGQVVLTDVSDWLLWSSLITCSGAMVIAIFLVGWAYPPLRPPTVISAMAVFFILRNEQHLLFRTIVVEWIVGVLASTFLVLQFFMVTQPIVRARKESLKLYLRNLSSKLHAEKVDGESKISVQIRYLLAANGLSSQTTWQTKAYSIIKTLIPIALVALYRVLNLIGKSGTVE